MIWFYIKKKNDYKFQLVNLVILRKQEFSFPSKKCKANLIWEEYFCRMDLNFKLHVFFTTSTHSTVFLSNSPGILSPLGAFLVPISWNVQWKKWNISLVHDFLVIFWSCCSTKLIQTFTIYWLWQPYEGLEKKLYFFIVVDLKN